VIRLDLRGQRCPLPVIELARRIGEVDVGQSLTVVSDDPAAASDIPAWCRMREHELVDVTGEPDGRGTAYVVRRLH
jgi:tRNA 2-thiouridine synthesizing protein A